jgi:hypothetical protein
VRYCGPVGNLFALSPWSRASLALLNDQPAISESLPTRCKGIPFARLILLSSFVRFLMTKLYVGNLPFTATEDAVRALFAPHGTVESLSLISDRETGRARGFGFVEMSATDASRAMQALNGTDFEGRPLKINEAQERSRSGGSSRY